MWTHDATAAIGLLGTAHGDVLFGRCGRPFESTVDDRRSRRSAARRGAPSFRRRLLKRCVRLCSATSETPTTPWPGPWRAPWHVLHAWHALDALVQRQPSRSMRRPPFPFDAPATVAVSGVIESREEGVGGWGALTHPSVRPCSPRRRRKAKGCGGTSVLPYEVGEQK